MTITLADLVRQIREMRGRGVTVGAIEVGPKTWKQVLGLCGVKSADEGWFMGMHIRRADVPEGKLWPLERA